MGTLIVKPKLDIDAKIYIDNVQDADGVFLEPDVKQSINRFVKGCKEDNNWDAIKASCILAGARTLAGALVPLAGTAPTNIGFTDDRYNRKTGLQGLNDATYLDTNYTSPNRDNLHMATFVTEVLNGAFMGSGTSQVTPNIVRMGNITAAVIDPLFLGLNGGARNNNLNFTYLQSGVVLTANIQSNTNDVETVKVFRRGNASPASSNPRIAFYSTGEALDLSKLNDRVNLLVSTLSEVIP